MNAIVLFTDFGPSGPYTGQVRRVLVEHAPRSPVIDLVNDAPRFSPRAAAHLLASLVGEFAPGSVFLCVVDPGVGTTRRALVVEAERRWLVGPDNGLLDVTAARARGARAWEISWRPERLSRTFHGRDLFAPVAARIANEDGPPESWLRPAALAPASAADLSEVVYIDTYGNAMTGLRARSVGKDAVLWCAGTEFRFAGTFAEATSGAPLWYENSNGLAELALNQGHVGSALGVAVGAPVAVRPVRRDPDDAA